MLPLGESDVVISTGALTANATAADIATALAADTDVNSSSSKYTVTAAEGKLSITRTDGVQFTVTKEGTDFLLMLRWSQGQLTL